MNQLTSTFFVALVATAHFAGAVEIPGKVIEASAGSAKVLLNADVVPGYGDPVVIYFRLPGGGEEVLVGAGSITSVSEHVASVRLDDAGITPQQDQLARINSPRSIKSVNARRRPVLSSHEVNAARERAERGDAEAMCELGRYHDPDLNVSGVANANEALSWYRKAAELGNARALYNLGSSYRRGSLGLPQDPTKAVELCRAAAERGHLYALYALGGSYEDGSGVEQNPAEALTCYRKAADAGFAPATYQLALALFEGRLGLRKDDDEGRKLLLRAVEQGAPEAQNRLATMYQNGEAGFPRDIRRAIELYRVAAEADWTRAQHNLGALYLHGSEGVEKDEGEALKFFQEAARKKFAPSIANVGWMYEHGLGGLPRDRTKALEHYRAAAAEGDEDGKRLAAALEARP